MKWVHENKRAAQMRTARSKDSPPPVWRVSNMPAFFTLNSGPLTIGSTPQKRKSEIRNPKPRIQIPPPSEVLRRRTGRLLRFLEVQKKTGSLASEFQFLRDCLQFIHQTRMYCISFSDNNGSWQSVVLRTTLQPGFSNWVR